jgi:major intrinsic protein
MATAVQSVPRRTGWRATTAGELVAECFGTFILICFGDGVVAMAVAALNQSGRGTQIFRASGDWLLIGWGWGLAVTFAVYAVGGVSGAHINPAVTVAFAARRGFPWRKVPLHRGPAARGVPGRPARLRRTGARTSRRRRATSGRACSLGAFAYDFLIHDVLSARGEQPQAVEERGRTVEEVV